MLQQVVKQKEKDISIFSSREGFGKFFSYRKDFQIMPMCIIVRNCALVVIVIVEVLLLLFVGYF